MPFGIRNATRTFQHFTDNVTRGLQGVFYYIDDILIASGIGEEQHLHSLFDRLQKAGVVINPGKSLLGVTFLTFLGHNITADDITPARKKISNIRHFPRPATERQLWKYLDKFRQDVHSQVCISTPLQRLLTPSRSERGRDITWTPETSEAFKVSKDTLASAPSLTTHSRGRSSV